MTKSFDPNLIDYMSAAFEVGFMAGQARQEQLDAPADADISAAEWASYCEGWLMGSSEPVWAELSDADYAAAFGFPPDHLLRERRLTAAGGIMRARLTGQT